jgi:hypothetical protein
MSCGLIFWHVALVNVGFLIANLLLAWRGVRTLRNLRKARAMLDATDNKRTDLRVRMEQHLPPPPEAWLCRVCGANLAYNQPVAPSCPPHCPLLDPATIP